MKLLITTPAERGSTAGNRITARRWAVLLRSLGHRVCVVSSSDRDLTLADFDVLLALHASRSAGMIAAWREQCGDRPLVVCLTGTDLHGDLANPESAGGRRARRSLEWADRIVLLEPCGAQRLDMPFQQKAVVILQSAKPLKQPPPRPTGQFVVAVIGHLRDVKDPFRGEAASRCLPPQSRIQIVHMGSALQPELAGQARQLERQNPRYRWLGGLPHAAAVRLLAGSHLMVNSSRIEGAPSSISEAIVNQVPVLATRIDAACGMLGNDYPGLFGVGQTRELADLMWRAESDSAFYEDLMRALNRLAGRYRPAAERQALRDLVAGW